MRSNIRYTGNCIGIILLVFIIFSIAVPDAFSDPFLCTGSCGFNVTFHVLALLGNYSNSSLNLSANQTTFIDTRNVTLALTSSENTSGSINLTLTSRPLDVPSLSIPSLDKYLNIEASSSITNNLSYVLIKLYYTDEEVLASGIEEGSLSLYWWNQTSSAWEKLSPAMSWVYGTGVDTIENYVWVNTTHFSYYGIGGRAMPPSIKLIRDMPSSVKTNQKFDINLQLANIADFDLFNISVKENIPSGYSLKDSREIAPRPAYVKDENGTTVIYWNIDRLASHVNMSLKYSVSVPGSAGNYIFRADGFGFDTLNNKYTAFNVTEQEVKKPSSWKS